VATAAGSTPPGVALVVGAGRSYGRAVAVELARQGRRVAALDGPESYRTLAYDVSTVGDVQATVDEINRLGGTALAVRADVRDLEGVKAAVRLVETELGPITDLIIASGVVSATPIARMSREHWDEVLDTNLTGAFHLVQAVVPSMSERRHGHVVLITGPEARRGFASLSHVAAAAWALVGLAKTVALEVASSNVTVNVISTTHPPSAPLNSIPELQSAAGASAPVVGQPPWEQISASNPQGRPYVGFDEVTAAVAFLLSDAARSWTGAVVDLSLGAVARNSA
jgi:NAD(P)-dependent dehydrogenase (short-subunit alcohol dehydrogenase family)